ncbi:hypothetical protein [Anaerohalosphaera lusitana]|uniref:hypothetical protein n=1 Tax=Anaerohalosphaera lusitana TaxID=1936003 RepID=UPI001473F37B|nr:hypothetical protein [Anaerohalosphaera lusitana]
MKKTAISDFSIVVWCCLFVALLCTYATWHLFSFKEAFTLLIGSYLAYIALFLCGFSAVLIFFVESIRRHTLKNKVHHGISGK